MKKGNIGLFVIVLIVAGVVLAGFYFSAQREGLNQGTLQTAQYVAEEKSEDIECNAQVRGNVENGNYLNNMSGFTVKVPDGWKLVEDCNDGKLNMISFEAPDNLELVSKDPKCIPCHNYVRRFDISIYPRGEATLSGLKVNIESAYNYDVDNTVIKATNKNGLEGFVVTGLVAGGVRSYYLLGVQSRYEIVHIESVESANVENPKYGSEFEAFVGGFKEI